MQLQWGAGVEEQGPSKHVVGGPQRIALSQWIPISWAPNKFEIWHSAPYRSLYFYY